jgi:hypothetical protein
LKAELIRAHEQWQEMSQMHDDLFKEHQDFLNKDLKITKLSRDFNKAFKKNSLPDKLN